MRQQLESDEMDVAEFMVNIQFGRMQLWARKVRNFAQQLSVNCVFYSFLAANGRGGRRGYGTQSYFGFVKR